MSTQNYTFTKDTFVASATPDANLDDGTLSIEDNWSGGKGGTRTYERTYLYVDFSHLMDTLGVTSGDEVDDAYIYLYCTGKSATGATADFTSVTGAWAEDTLTFNTSPAEGVVGDILHDIGTSPGVGAWGAWSVRTHIRALVDAATPILDCNMRVNNGSSGLDLYAEFDSREGTNPPYLRIDYTLAGGGSVKKISGVPWANVKKVSGVAEASIKKVSGVTAN